MIIRDYGFVPAIGIFVSFCWRRCSVVRFVILISILRDKKKITNIYEYVKYNFCCLYRGKFAFQKGNPGKALQVYKNVNLLTEIQCYLIRRTDMHSPFHKV